MGGELLDEVVSRIPDDDGIRGQSVKGQTEEFILSKGDEDNKWIGSGGSSGAQSGWQNLKATPGKNKEETQLKCQG